jgi:hypothetical protein
MMIIRREWAMPNSCTFQVGPIRALLAKYVLPGQKVVDPFARDASMTEFSNDINPETSAAYHMDAVEFLDAMVHEGHGASFDVALLDPPYSPRQMSEAYQSAGLTPGMTGTQNARLYSECRRRLWPLLKPGGLALSFGWNSSGFGKKYQADVLEILMVCHGGAHNDTICVVERKPFGLLDLLD